MNTMTLPFADLTPIDADTQAILDKLMTGQPLDTETYQRIRERAERASAELRRRFGERTIAVDLIWASRDEA